MNISIFLKLEKVSRTDWCFAFVSFLLDGTLEHARVRVHARTDRKMKFVIIPRMLLTSGHWFKNQQS